MKYIEPEFEMIKFKGFEDVITTSDTEEAGGGMIVDPTNPNIGNQ